MFNLITFQGEIRISKLIKDGESARYGPIPGWRHVDCFVKDRLELEYSDSADKYVFRYFKKLFEVFYANVLTIKKKIAISVCLALISWKLKIKRW